MILDTWKYCVNCLVPRKTVSTFWLDEFKQAKYAKQEELVKLVKIRTCGYITLAKKREHIVILS